MNFSTDDNLPLPQANPVQADAIDFNAPVAVVRNVLTVEAGVFIDVHQNAVLTSLLQFATDELHSNLNHFGLLKSHLALCGSH
jgi:hypothetical protein